MNILDEAENLKKLAEEAWYEAIEIFKSRNKLT